MWHQTKWFGLSLALHLTVASGLIVMAARNAERTPKAIMVILDNLDSTDLPQLKAPQAAARAVVRPPAPANPGAPLTSKPEALKPEQPPSTPQPVMAQSSATNQPPEQSQTRAASKVSSEHAVVASSRTTSIGSAPQPGQQTAVPAEGAPSPEKAQQRYLKEHFTYIRDLITKQLVYPPMARRMNWSGKVVVAFTIAEDGSVHGIRVTETSGYPILDKSAIETVRSVAPFPKPPVRAEIAVPINFRMMH